MVNTSLMERLYNSYGAYSYKALDVLFTLTKYPDGRSLHEIVFQCGYAFRFISNLLDSFVSTGEIKKAGDIYALKSKEFSKSILLAVNKKEYHVSLENLLPIYRKIVDTFTKHKKDLDQVSVTPETLLNRVKHITSAHDLSKCKILFLGDHDFTSIALALYCKERDISPLLYVVDLDDDVLQHIEVYANRQNLDIVTAKSDFRYHIPRYFRDSMDVVFTDPPYSPDGMDCFIRRAIEAANKSPFSIFYICYKTAETSPAVGFSVQKTLQNHKLFISSIYSNFNIYFGAEALGYRSNLYECRILPDAHKSVDSLLQGKRGIYTHGKNSIESNAQKLDSDQITAILKATDTSSRSIIYVCDEQDGLFESISCTKKRITLTDFITSQLNGTNKVARNATHFFNLFTSSLDTTWLITSISSLDEFLLIMPYRASKFRGIYADLLNAAYQIDVVYSSNLVSLLSIKKRNNFTNQCKAIIANMFFANSSLIKNSFCKSASSVLGITKNEARTIFSKLDIKLLISELFLYELSSYKLCQLYEYVCSVLNSNLSSSTE